MQFEVLVLGSTNAPRPHIVRISGYPPNLSVLDFLELAEAGKTFGNIQLMDGLKWSMMCLRKSGESEPLQTNQPLYVENGSRVIIGTVRLLSFMRMGWGVGLLKLLIGMSWLLGICVIRLRTPIHGCNSLSHFVH